MGVDIHLNPADRVPKQRVLLSFGGLTLCHFSETAVAFIHLLST
jgi:hypothetical protein